MYGMIPSAKIEKRDSAPPENMLNMSRIPPSAKRAKIILAGAAVEKKLNVSGIGASKGAREAIEKAGGSVAALVAAEAPKKLAKKAKPAAAK